MGNLQDVFNLLPNLSTPKVSSLSVTANSLSGAAQIENSELARAMSVKTNDQLMTIYLSSLIRAITAFHDLIENKIQNRQQQEEKDAKKDGEGKDGESKDGKKINGVTNGDSKDEAKADTGSKEKGRETGRKR